MIKRLLTFFLFCLFLTGSVLYSPYAAARLAGQARVDSLLNELSQANEDEHKVDILNAVAYTYCMIDPAKGKNYAMQGLTLARQLDYKSGIAASTEELGNNCSALSDYPGALEYLLKALGMYEDLHDKKHIAGTLGNVGNIYINQENYPKALEYYFQILKMFGEMNDTADVAITYGNIANVYADQNKLDSALEYNNKALKMCEALDDKRGIASNIKNIGGIYESQQNYGEALAYDFNALRKFEALGNKLSVAVCIGDIGECYLTMARDTIKVHADSLVPAGKAEQLAKAIDYTKQAIAICSAIGNLDNLQKYYQNLSDIQVLADDYKGALESYKQYVALHDSVFGEQDKVKMVELAAQRDIDVKNKQIEIDKLTIAKRHSERIFYITGICLLFLAVIGMLISYVSQRRSNTRLSKEKKRSDDLLLNILPADVADELKEKGRSMARYFDNVTVMFTDFVDFTHAGEMMSPQQLVDELDTCFKAFDDIIRRHYIEKIKTVGDAYMAAAGVPRPNAHHAEDVIRAALEIREFMRARKEKMGNDTFDVRIGVHSGYVVAGIVGATKFAYDIWGDTVNTAARMEQSSVAGKINISETTYELVKDKFTCSHRGQLEAKNKGSLNMYFVEN